LIEVLVPTIAHRTLALDVYAEIARKFGMFESQTPRIGSFRLKMDDLFMALAVAVLPVAGNFAGSFPAESPYTLQPVSRSPSAPSRN
jgi:hypothetical protein